MVEPKIASKAEQMERLKRRTDFKAAAKGARAPAGAFVLQARCRIQEGQEDGRESSHPVRVGFTVSRQVGNAVERNRVRRRLREMVRLAPTATLRPGHDYVLIGRRTALGADFADMTRQLDAAIRRIHAVPQSGQGNRQGSEQGNGQARRAATGGGADAPLHRTGSPEKRRDGRRDGRPLKSGPHSDEHKSG
ncbi:MAG: ribonuclease P protein component [Xanthobacteraceae bacterium]